MPSQPAPPLVFLHPGLPFVLVLIGGVLLGLGLRMLLVRWMTLARFRKITNRIEEGVLTVLFLAIVFLSCLQLVLRNFFHSGLVWIDPVLRYIVLWLAFLGAMTAASRGRHISIDVLPRLFPRARVWLHRLSASVAALVCIAMANGAYEYLRQEYQFGREALLGLRTWQLQSILLFGFMLLAYRFLVYILWGVREEREEPVV
jgi:TRAP-type C4-dicarboxylate transport system permease small subunit